ncbi:SRPBCC family protein [Haloferula sp. BvORR071]|uniref:SRPBCC family protein n=1 Tax=Haloferula sp. BvORR071 TaxID=1396141 RepID=UPI0005516C69
MALIELQTVIDAPVERVFDLARSIDAHQDSAEGTHERAVAGVTSGLIGFGEEVTWEARHFGITQRLSVKITKFDRPRHFQDVILKGAFHRMQHDHYFEDQDGRTIMRDRFEFQSPLGPLGRIFDAVVLTHYMRRFLVKRNAILKQAAESNAWEKYPGGIGL